MAPDLRLAFASNPIAPIPKVQLYEQICARIAEQIRCGEWRPGQRLPSERELARTFGVSRPTLREALGALQMIGIVETQHGSGSRVSGKALEFLADNAATGEFGLGVSPVALLEARLSLEPIIASFAAERYTPDPNMERLLKMMDEARDWENPMHRSVWSNADVQFHRQIAAHTNNPVLLSVGDSIASVMSEPLWRRLRDETLAEPGRIAASVDEHRRIYEAIQNGSPEDAARCAREHIDVVRKYMGLDQNKPPAARGKGRPSETLPR
jgi:DNA-binding FadR family transcriptional regulator